MIEVKKDFLKKAFTVHTYYMEYSGDNNLWNVIYDIDGECDNEIEYFSNGMPVLFENGMSAFSCIESVRKNYDGKIICLSKDDNKDLWERFYCSSKDRCDEEIPIYSALDTDRFYPPKGTDSLILLVHSMDELVEETIRRHLDTPSGLIHDADTILEDILMEQDEHIHAEELFEIWQKSTDKGSVEELFYSFTGTGFAQYLCRCMEEITENPRNITSRNLNE